MRSCCIVWTLLLSITAAAVFVEKREANTLLPRSRRANSGFLEELKQGNLERECIEEICDYEEAREVFEDDHKTRQFWLTYDRRDPCLENPCQNNGTCVYVGTSYDCQCPEGFEGRYCQTVFEDSLKCLYLNGHCQHFCDGSGQRRKCSCAHGYKLADDGRRCLAQDEFPCGQLAPQETGLNQSIVGQTRLVGANHCPRGECPWQVLVQLNQTGPHHPELAVLLQSRVQPHPQHAVCRVPGGSARELPWRRRQPADHAVRLHPLLDGCGGLGAGLFTAWVLWGVHQHGQLCGLGGAHHKSSAHHHDSH